MNCFLLKWYAYRLPQQFLFLRQSDSLRSFDSHELQGRRLGDFGGFPNSTFDRSCALLQIVQVQNKGIKADYILLGPK